MTASWVAGTTRARALVRRRLGMAGARRLVATGSLSAAVLALADTPYGHDMRPGHGRVEAQRAVLSTLLWHVRVLAGWAPRDGVAVMRLLARWFEIANVDEVLSGGRGPFDLGSLGTSWPRLRQANAPADLRAALATSPWGDPGDERPRQIQLGMRLSWAAHLADAVDVTVPWAAGATALLIARERHLDGRDLHPLTLRRSTALLGSEALRAGSLADMAARLPSAARWALQDLERPDDLWRGELRWWDRLERDGTALLSDSRFRLEPVVGALAVLAADARRVHAALELAARGGDPDELA